MNRSPLVTIQLVGPGVFTVYGIEPLPILLAGNQSLVSVYRWMQGLPDTEEGVAQILRTPFYRLEPAPDYAQTVPDYLPEAPYPACYNPERTPDYTPTVPDYLPPYSPPSPSYSLEPGTGALVVHDTGSVQSRPDSQTERERELDSEEEGEGSKVGSEFRHDNDSEAEAHAQSTVEPMNVNDSGVEEEELPASTEDPREGNSEREDREKRMKFLKFKVLVDKKTKALLEWGESILKRRLPLEEAFAAIDLKTEEVEAIVKREYAREEVKERIKEKQAVETKIREKHKELCLLEQVIEDKRRWAGELRDRRLPERNWWPGVLKEGLEIHVLITKDRPQYQVNSRFRGVGTQTVNDLATDRREWVIQQVLAEVCSLLRVDSQLYRNLVDQLYKKQKASSDYEFE